MLFHLISLALLPALSDAYSWQFNSEPEQCSNVSLSITGSGGTQPYTMLIVPSGASPLSGGVEVRKIQSFQFDGTDLTFDLNYPENSEFIVVVSDASGFGSGGTSAPVAVTSSSDSSCYNVNDPVQANWTFSTDGTPNECSTVRLWWEQSDISGSPNFLGVIPHGDSFSIPNGTTSTNADTGTGFDWTVDIAAGTNFFIVAGDNSGVGTGGSGTFTVGYSSNSSCLDSSSPSSTTGSPAGGNYPTSTDGATTGGNSSSSSGSSSSGGGGSNVGAIVGGVVGGVGGLMVIALVALFFWRRRRFHKGTQEKPVDLINDAEDDPSRPGDVPHYYAPEPFLVPDPTAATTTDGRTSSDGAPYGAATASQRPSSFTETDPLRPGTPQTTTTSSGAMRKSPLPPSFRPMNIIQHDDAGPSVPGEPTEDGDTIELPPAYTNIRK